MRQQQVPRRPRKRSSRDDHSFAEPAPRARRLAENPAADAEALLDRIEQLLHSAARGARLTLE